MTVPAAPRNPSVTPGNGRVVFNWMSPLNSGTGGSAITSYQVSSDGGTTWVTASSNTSHTFTGLTNGTNYTLSVRAVNIMGGGAQANLTVRPSATATIPNAPRSFTATPGDRQVTLSWIAPSSNGGAAITSYQISRDGGVTWVTASSNTSHTLTGLTNGTSYSFHVRAVNSAGIGPAATVLATPATVPGAIRSFRVTPGNGQVVLNWINPLSNGGSAITSYQVSQDSGTTWVTASGNLTHTFTGLTNGTSYIFMVRAVNSVGNGGAASVPARPSTTQIVPTVPRSLVATPGDRQVTLNWIAPANNGGAPITSYLVSRDGGVTWVTSSSSTSHTFTGLTNGTSYTFNVRAVNRVGNSPTAAISSILVRP